MDDEDNDYELERQKTIAENRELLDSLGLDPSGASKIPGAQPKLAKPKTKPAGVKRKAPAVKADEGPRRRSGRLAGIEATAEEIQKREEAEEVEREIIRVVNRKIRDQVMDLDKMVEDSSPNTAEELDPYLKHISCLENPKVAPKEDSTDMDDYTDKETLPAEVQRLKAAFKGMTLRANAKVTSERVFSMVVHPEKTKTLVFAGDKNGMLGIWDALGQSDEKVTNEDDTSGAAVDDGEEEEGKIWHVQAHARSSITAMKIDPVSGSGLYSSSYDCSLRHIDFATLNSRELFSLPDEDMLITHFDLTPNGNEAWIADKNGGISHCDFREPGKRRGEDKESRRRWVVQEEGRAAKLGGISVNPAMPHLVLTAGNDQHLRIWDTRHLTAMTPKAAEYLSSEPEKSNGVKSEYDPLDLNGESVTAPHVNTHPSSSIPYESIDQHTKSAKNKDKGLLRASYQHGKSCSAAYWDPRGRRILTTSYDDKLRIWDVKPNSLAKEAVLAPTHFQPYVKIPHNCQTGRWLTILRAQWSLNMDHMPHFTVGNMKRTLDVVAATGDKIVSLWTDGVSAVPAVTASHPHRVDHVLGGNTSGRVQLWTASP